MPEAWATSCSSKRSFPRCASATPGARVELVCRADVAPVATLHAQPPDAVVEFDFDPYRWALPDDRAALHARSLLRRIGRPPVDLFVSAELRATWLSEIPRRRARAGRSGHRRRAQAAVK